MKVRFLSSFVVAIVGSTSAQAVPSQDFLDCKEIRVAVMPRDLLARNRLETDFVRKNAALIVTIRDRETIRALALKLSQERCLTSSFNKIDVRAVIDIIDSHDNQLVYVASNSGFYASGSIDELSLTKCDPSWIWNGDSYFSNVAHFTAWPENDQRRSRGRR